MKPVILINREIACISKTANRRDLGPCLNDSEGPILGGGSSERRFSPTSTVFSVTAKKASARKGEISPPQATGIELSVLYTEFFFRSYRKNR